MQTETPTGTPRTARPARWAIWVILFGLVLAASAYLRYTGMNWDASQHLHPDERFLTMVESALGLPQNPGEYFNTPQAPLNPNNRGYGFYVYGDLPIIIVRYLAEWLGKSGYDEVYLVGRYTSATFDMLTVLLVFLAAQRLFRKPWLSLLASAFYGLAVLPIQLSHYFTTDSFLTFFGLLTLYFAFVVSTSSPPLEPQPAEKPDDEPVVEQSAGGQVFRSPEPEHTWRERFSWLKLHWNTAVPYALFGLALGMAMASKVSAFLIALALPLAAYVYWSRVHAGQQERWTVILLRNLVIGGLVALISFRIFMPYAFAGPGFFGLKINPQWWANIKELASQSSGEQDFPPALQWSRRPVTFAWENLVRWGLGLPLGLLALGGFAWMAWRMVKGEWRRYLVLWVFTLYYSLWWGLNFSRTMRYQNVVYPTLAIIAAWVIVWLWERRSPRRRKMRWSRIAAWAIALIVLVTTAAYAYAFSGIYRNPMTRVAASQWIYQNIPAPVNLQVETAGGLVNHPLGFRYNYDLAPGDRWVLAFQLDQPAVLNEIYFSHIADNSGSPDNKNLMIQVKEAPDRPESLTTAYIFEAFPPDNDRGREYRIPFENQAALNPGQTYYLVLTVGEGNGPALTFSGPMALSLTGQNGALQQPLPEPILPLRDLDPLFTQDFTPNVDGIIKEVYLPHILDWTGRSEPKTLTLTLANRAEGVDPSESHATLSASFLAGGDWRGDAYTFTLDRPFAVKAGTSYSLELSKAEGPGEIALYGSKTAIESTWDDPLPLPMEGYSPFDYNNGLYRTDLNFEMYWDDDANKLNHFVTILNQTDYILISSNRQWGTTVRVPERYPLTTFYYRNLLGCPEEKSIIDCYAVARPGMFKGSLGFDLVQVFQSDPRLGPLDWNTQFAEEAFTVYDAPKVLIFKKTVDYRPEQVQALLSGVDLSTVVHVTPVKAGSNPANLMLPPVMLAVQRAGGTWSKLFDTRAIFNAYPGLGLVLWYLVLTLLGWVVYPIVRLALRGLPDRGYPFSKLVALLLMAYFTWLAGSAGIPVTKLTITAVVLLLLSAGLALAYVQREELAEEWRERKRYFLAVEAVALAFFAVDLLIRLGNPDLWHPYKGGEKPMDFSYFNAVLKSTVFPPYDPWFAGGYINYYYFGFVIAAVPVKWLGIVPSIAYNLVLPTFFSLLALGAFSFGWNILSARRPQMEDGESQSFLRRYRVPLAAGLAAAVAILILGNLGTVRMIWHGVMRLAAPDGNLDNSNLFERFAWTFKGIAAIFTGARLPYGDGDWYWIPSRVYPRTEITEFPFFTFLYADPHAHLFALPLTVLALAWALSIVMGKWRWGDRDGRGSVLHFAVSFFLGGLVTGALRPVNTWDLPTYLAIAVIAVAYTALRYSELFAGRFFEWPERRRKLLTAFGSVALLVGLAVLLFQPYARWYVQGYNAVEIWKGDRSPFWSYLTHWGLFLFVIVTWLVWETRDWMASTPVSALNRLKPFQPLILGLALVLFGAIIGLSLLKVQIAWLVLLLAAWTGVLLLRPGLPDLKRFVLFMIGTALVLTLAVEVIVLKGDIDRMNTVFKFYLQAWTLLSLSAAVALVWLWPAVENLWSGFWRGGWQIALALLTAGALLYPITASAYKIKDRMSPAAPHTLDGMAYMPYSTYADFDQDMKLIQDYMAIRWMQENVQGSPVIVEANTPEYRWGTRYTIYTGLPGVVGWNWHQRQQRGGVIPGDWIFARVDAVANFYTTEDRQQVVDFLRQYDVRYIVVGQLEKAEYRGPGLDKFNQWSGDLWKPVFQLDDTTIYEVIQ